MQLKVVHGDQADEDVRCTGGDHRQSVGSGRGGRWEFDDAVVVAATDA